MIPAQLPHMIAAELRKILTRGTGQLGLVVAVLVGIAPVVLLNLIRDAQGGMTVNNTPMSQMLAFEVYTALSWALTGRNFFVMPLILLTLTAQLVAGEWGDRTLRALVLRPVPRWSVLFAKLSALTIYAGLTLLLTASVAALGGLATLERTADINPAVLGFAATWLTDLGLICIGILVSTIVPSVSGVIVGTILFLMADMALRLLLKGAAFFGLGWAEVAGSFLPGTSLAAWEGYAGGWDTRAFAGLVLLVVTCALLGGLRFERRDIP